MCMCVCGDCGGGLGVGGLLQAFIWRPRIIGTLPSLIHGFSILDNKRGKSIEGCTQKILRSVLKVEHIITVLYITVLHMTVL